MNEKVYRSGLYDFGFQDDGVMKFIKLVEISKKEIYVRAKKKKKERKKCS